MNKSVNKPLNENDIALATLRGIALPDANLFCTSVHYDVSKEVLVLEMSGGSIALPVKEVEEFNKFSLKESDFSEFEIAFAGKVLSLKNKDLDFSILGLIKQSSTAMSFVKNLSSFV